MHDCYLEAVQPAVATEHIPVHLPVTRKINIALDSETAGLDDQAMAKRGKATRNRAEVGPNAAFNVYTESFAPASLKAKRYQSPPEGRPSSGSRCEKSGSITPD
jgi:hypothetical protein